MKKIIVIISGLCSFGLATGQVHRVSLPVPSHAQQKWQNENFYLFAHFGPNTFTDLEWGKGTEKAEVFDPKDLDCDQWCRIAKAAGAAGIVITAKHHDGFCLWPSKYSHHTVRESDWKNGKGDVLRELSTACKKYGLKFGVYLSPWDRNHPAYGTPAYNDVFANMLKEIFTNYGPIWELWWDGANGEGPNGKKQVYDFGRFEKLVRGLSPNTIIFSDIGPDARWCGNEKGYAGKTDWDNLDTTGFKRGAGAPPQDTLNSGNEFGHHFIPAECDVSIRPGWFYHKNEDSLVKSPQKLFEIYLKSVGRGANLILNVPPDRRGLFTRFDSSALMGFKKLRDQEFSNNLAAYADSYFMSAAGKQAMNGGKHSHKRPFMTFTDLRTQAIEVKFRKAEKVNCIELKENVAKGQRCAAFTIRLYGPGHQLVKQIDGTTIGHQRILTFPAAEVNSVRFSVTRQKAPTKIYDLEIYSIMPDLVEK